MTYFVYADGCARTAVQAGSHDDAAIRYVRLYHSVPAGTNSNSVSVVVDDNKGCMQRMRVQVDVLCRVMDAHRV